VTNAALPLSGTTIAVPETRESDRFAAMLEEQGATVFRCPLLAIVDAPDAAAVEAWLRRLARGDFGLVVLMTGEGIRRMMPVAQRCGIHAEVVEGFRRAVKVTRGPKPAKELKNLGLSPDLHAASPTTEGVIETLKSQDLKGKRVGVQLYGDEPNEKLIEFIASAGGTAEPVVSYVYAPASDDSRCVELIEKMNGGSIDMIAFTSAGQWKYLADAAARTKREDALHSGLARVKVAAVGPVVEEALKSANVRVDIVPQRPFVLKELVKQILALK
jgi:uroporphyrinogen-III synthase